MIRKLVPVLVVGLALAGLAAAAASAHKKLFASDVSAQITNAGATPRVVSGVVTSPKKACLRGRKVLATIFDPAKLDEPTIGTAITDTTGAFQFTLPEDVRGTVALVEVKSKRIPPKTKKHKHTCGSGTGPLSIP